MAKIDDGMEIGLCWGTLQGADLAELIEAAGRHGFPTLSVRPDMILAHVLDGPGERDLRRRLADACVRVTVIDALSSGLPGMREGTEASGGVDACFRAAEAVDCLLINVTLYGGEPAPLDEVAAALGHVSRRAAEWGQGLVLEFVPDTGVPDLATARQVVEAVGETNFRIMLDPWHLARSGGTLEDVLSLPPGMIGGFQLDDRIPPAAGTTYVPMTGRDLPGEGQLPLHELTRAALANNPELTAEVEVFSQELRDMSTDAAAARVATAVKAWRQHL